MSVLVKGMEMPKCCFDCSCLNDEYCQCQAAGKTIEVDWVEHRPDWCPLIEVPPHGRLIDADELKNDIHYTDDFYETPFVWWDDILESPTVIHADKKEVEE